MTVTDHTRCANDICVLPHCPGRAIAANCPGSSPGLDFRWIYDFESRLFMNAAGAARGLMDDERYRGDGCLSTGIDFWSNATVLALEGRALTTPTWSWKYKGVGLQVKAATGVVTGKAETQQHKINDRDCDYMDDYIGAQYSVCAVVGPL